VAALLTFLLFVQELETKWKAYPSLNQVWRRNWVRITPFFNYPPDIRKAIYTTNRLESLNRSLRKIIKTRSGFRNEEAALKLLFLALRQEVDDANSSLTRSPEPLHDSLAGTHVGPGESYAMKPGVASIALGPGGGFCNSCQAATWESARYSVSCNLTLVSHLLRAFCHELPALSATKC